MQTEPCQEHARMLDALFEGLTSAHLKHPSGSLRSHLVRTARRLETWGAEPSLVSAGLCHAAYGTQGFAEVLLPLSARPRLRLAIGDAAEAIVYAYCAWDRALGRHGELRDRFSGEYWVANAWLRRQLAELTAANELDVLEHAACSAADLAAIHELFAYCEPDLSYAARAAIRAHASQRLPAHAVTADAEIAYRDLGARGERVVLWHGGASPELTWSRQHGLCDDLQLRIPWRRGLAPSVSALRQDWAADARDLLRVMPEGSHVVSHSYGAVSALVAAACAPQRFRSLTLIEPPVWCGAADDEEVQQLAALGRAFARGAPEARTAFLALAALPLEHAETARVERLARDLRDPREATPNLQMLRAAKLPIAVVSGGHNQAIERMCDALGDSLDAQRWRFQGAGHAVQRDAGFNGRLRDFIAAACAGTTANLERSA